MDNNVLFNKTGQFQDQPVAGNKFYLYFRLNQKINLNKNRFLKTKVLPSVYVLKIIPQKLRKICSNLTQLKESGHYSYD